jgi:hypothetical protein
MIYQLYKHLPEQIVPLRMKVIRATHYNFTRLTIFQKHSQLQIGQNAAHKGELAKR